MNIDANQIETKPKKVGLLKNKPVFHLKTKGGLHLIVSPRGSSFDTLGTGSHRAIATHIAQKHEPDIIWNELQKSEHVDLQAFQGLVPSYEELTAALRKLGS